MSMTNVIGIFHNTGFFPTYRHKIQLPGQAVNPEQSSITKNNNLAFVPPFSSSSKKCDYSDTLDDTEANLLMSSSSSPNSDIERNNLLVPQKPASFSKLLKGPDLPCKLHPKYWESSD